MTNTICLTQKQITRKCNILFTWRLTTQLRDTHQQNLCSPSSRIYTYTMSKINLDVWSLYFYNPKITIKIYLYIGVLLLIHDGPHYIDLFIQNLIYSTSLGLDIHSCKLFHHPHCSITSFEVKRILSWVLIVALKAFDLKLLYFV